MMNWKTLQQLVPQAGQSPDFNACLAAFPQLELAKTTPQNPVYHASGPYINTTEKICL